MAKIEDVTVAIIDEEVSSVLLFRKFPRTEMLAFIAVFFTSHWKVNQNKMNPYLQRAGHLGDFLLFPKYLQKDRSLDR